MSNDLAPTNTSTYTNTAISAVLAEELVRQYGPIIANQIQKLGEQYGPSFIEFLNNKLITTQNAAHDVSTSLHNMVERMYNYFYKTETTQQNLSLDEEAENLLKEFREIQIKKSLTGLEDLLESEGLTNDERELIQSTTNELIQPNTYAQKLLAGLTPSSDQENLGKYIQELIEDEILPDEIKQMLDTVS